MAHAKTCHQMMHWDPSSLIYIVLGASEWANGSGKVRSPTPKSGLSLATRLCLAFDPLGIYTHVFNKCHQPYMSGTTFFHCFNKIMLSKSPLDLVGRQSLAFTRKNMGSQRWLTMMGWCFRTFSPVLYLPCKTTRVFSSPPLNRGWLDFTLNPGLAGENAGWPLSE